MKRYSLLSILAVCAGSLFAANDSIQVSLDFNANPWGLTAAQMSGTSWSSVDVDNSPASAFLTEGYDFHVTVAEGKEVSFKISASNYLLTDKDNCLAYTYDYDNEKDGVTPRINVLFLYTGTTMDFKAPEGYRFAKAYFNVYRTWSSGGIASADEANTWRPELDTTYYQRNDKGEVTWEIESWHGTDTEWGTPACTSSTRLRSIDLWLLPTKEAGIEQINEETAPDSPVYNVSGQKANAKGLRICNGSVYFFE